MQVAQYLQHDIYSKRTVFVTFLEKGIFRKHNTAKSLASLSWKSPLTYLDSVQSADTAWFFILNWMLW